MRKRRGFCVTPVLLILTLWWHSHEVAAAVTLQATPTKKLALSAPKITLTGNDFLTTANGNTVEFQLSSGSLGQTSYSVAGVSVNSIVIDLGTRSTTGGTLTARVTNAGGASAWETVATIVGDPFIQPWDGSTIAHGATVMTIKGKNFGTVEANVVTLTSGSANSWAPTVAQDPETLVVTFDTPPSTSQGQYNIFVTVTVHGFTTDSTYIVKVMFPPQLTATTTIISQAAVSLVFDGSNIPEVSPIELIFPTLHPQTIASNCTWKETIGANADRVECAVSGAQFPVGPLTGMVTTNQRTTSVEAIAVVVAIATTQTRQTKVAYGASQMQLFGTDLQQLTQVVFSGAGAGTAIAWADTYDGDGGFGLYRVDLPYKEHLSTSGGPVYISGFVNRAPLPATQIAVIVPQHIVNTGEATVVISSGQFLTIRGQHFDPALGANGVDVKLKGTGIDLPGGFGKGGKGSDHFATSGTVVDANTVTVEMSILVPGGLPGTLVVGEIEAAVTQHYFETAYVKVGNAINLPIVLVPNPIPVLAQSATSITIRGERLASAFTGIGETNTLVWNAQQPLIYTPASALAVSDGGSMKLVINLQPEVQVLYPGSLKVGLNVYNYLTNNEIVATVVSDPTISLNTTEISLTSTKITFMGADFDDQNVANTVTLSGSGLGTAAITPTVQATSGNEITVDILTGSLQVGDLYASVHCHGAASAVTLIAKVVGTLSSAPVSLRVSNTGTTAVTLTWDPPANNGGYPISSYELLWNAGVAGGPQVSYAVISDPPFTVIGLTANTGYMFTLRAINPIGKSPPSNLAAVATTAAGQLTGMAIPSASSIVPDGATISWTPPFDTGGVPIQTYELYRDHASTNTQLDVKIATTDPATRQVVIRGLLPSTSYRVRVKVIPASGRALESPILSVTTLAPQRPYPVPLPSFSAVYVRTLVVSWNAPFSTGGSEITSYKVYRAVTASAGALSTTPPTLLETLPATKTDSALQGLEPSSDYFYVITAVNALGESDMTNIGQVTTRPPTRPGPPPAPTPTQPGPDSIGISVTAPSDDGGSMILQYKLYYSQVVSGTGSQSTSTTRELTSSSQFFQVSGLKTNTEYQFQVVAINVNGTSDRSPIAKGTTSIGETITGVQPDGGPGLTNDTIRVTITGRYFGTSASELQGIFIGGKACAASVWKSDSEVWCEGTPDHPTGGSELIQIRTSRAVPTTAPSGGSQAVTTWTSAYPVVYTFSRPGFPGPPPIVESVTPRSGSALGGTLVTITGRHFESDFNLEVMSLAGVICTNIKMVNPTTATCVSAAGKIGLHGSAEVVTLNGGTSVPPIARGTDGSVPSPPAEVIWTYENPVPQVDNVRPKIATDVGGDVVTIQGKFFGVTAPSDLRVTIDSRVCQSPKWLSSNLVSCVVAAAPAGTEYGLKTSKFMVSHSSRSSVSKPLAFGYGPVCNVPCSSWNAYCLGDVCTCAPGFVGPPACNTSLIVAQVGGVKHISENGVESQLAITLGAKPSRPVNILLSSSDPSEGLPEPNELSFFPSEFESDDTTVVSPVTKIARIVPVKDAIRDGNVTFEIDIAATSQDARFHEFGISSVEYVNDDTLPAILGITPSLIPLRGGVVTITASDIDARVQAYMINPGSGKRTGLTRLSKPPVANTTTTTTSTDPKRNTVNLLEQSLPSVSESFPDAFSLATLATNDAPSQSVQIGGSPPTAAELLYFEIPATTSTGYSHLELVNANGGRQLFKQGIFSSDDCPMPGMFGRGADCRPCPEGGVCPGGYRMWSKPGYWTRDEEAGWVEPCDPRENCMAWDVETGRVLCSQGQSGYMCSDCAIGYYSVGEACITCPETSEIYMYVACDMAIWLIVCLCAWFMKNDENFQRVIGFVVVMQTMGGAGTMASSSLPDSLLVVYDALHLFMSDYEVTKPDCQASRPTFGMKYGQNLAYVSLVGAGLASGALVLNFLLPWWRRRQGREQAALDAREFYTNRLVRIGGVWLSVVYLSLTRHAFRALYCDHFGSDGLHVVPDPTTRCFTADHGAAFAASVLVVIGVTIGWPVFAFYKMRRNRGHLFETQFLARWGTLYTLYKPAYVYFGLLMYTKLAILAVAEAFLATNPTARFVLLLSVFGLSGGLVFRLAPYEVSIDDWVHIFVDVWEVLALLVNYLGDSGTLSEHSRDSLSITVLVLMALVLIVLVSDLAYHVICRPMWNRRAARKAGFFDPDRVDDDAGGSELGDTKPLLHTVSEGWLLQSLSQSLPSKSQPAKSALDLQQVSIRFSESGSNRDSTGDRVTGDLGQSGQIPALAALVSSTTAKQGKPSATAGSIPGVIIYNTLSESQLHDSQCDFVVFEGVTLLCNLDPWTIGDTFPRAELDKQKPILRLMRPKADTTPLDATVSVGSVPQYDQWEYRLNIGGQAIPSTSAHTGWDTLSASEDSYRPRRTYSLDYSTDDYDRSSHLRSPVPSTTASSGAELQYGGQTFRFDASSDVDSEADLGI